MRYFLFLLSTLIICSTAMGQSFREFLETVKAQPDSADRSRLIASYLKKLSATPVIDDSTVTFLYVGTGRVVSVPSELNSWDPARGIMTNLAGTSFFYRQEMLPSDRKSVV